MKSNKSRLLIYGEKNCIVEADKGDLCRADSPQPWREPVVTGGPAASMLGCLPSQSVFYSI